MNLWVFLGKAFRQFASIFLWLFELWRENKREFNAALRLARKLVIAAKDLQTDGTGKAEAFDARWSEVGDELAAIYTGSKSSRNLFRELAFKELQRLGVIE